MMVAGRENGRATRSPNTKSNGDGSVMGELLSFVRHGAGASATAEADGLDTSAGQATSAGQLSENHRITTSYLRAVNVVSPASKRSKKRQSPAASRPIVAGLHLRASAYAAEQVSKCERSSVSMVEHPSRNFPTLQEVSVGKFRLAHSSIASDKSDMPTVDEVRQTIARAMEKAGEGYIRLGDCIKADLGIERNYVRDFMIGKKDSMKTEVMDLISRRYRIPFRTLIISKKKRIRTTG